MIKVKFTIETIQLLKRRIVIRRVVISHIYQNKKVTLTLSYCLLINRL